MAGTKLLDVIKFEGDNSALIWKHPVEDFNINSQLIVNETQEAIFFKDGQALDLFGPGRHSLKTENLPWVGEFIKKFTGDSPFHCQVYFINKAEAMAIKWGTPDPVLVMEDGVPFKLGASGDMSIRVSDSRKLLLKLVGTDAVLDRKQFISLFRNLMSVHIGDFIVNTKKEAGYSFFEMDGKKGEFSKNIKLLLEPDFEDYGIILERFNLSCFLFPEEDPNYIRMMQLYADQTLANKEKDLEIGLKFKDVDANNEIRMRNISTDKGVNLFENEIKMQNAGTDLGIKKQQVELDLEIRQREAELKRYEIEQEAMALKQKRELEGYSYQQEQGFDVAKGFASNQGGNDMVGLGIGLGMMNSVGKSVSENLGSTVNAAMTAAAVAPHINAQMQPASASGALIKCAKCGNELPANAKFCLNCGEKVVQPNADEMICPACGKTTPKGKFCMECGTLLASVCPKCGKEVPAGGKFCLECGTKL